MGHRSENRLGEIEDGKDGQREGVRAAGRLPTGGDRPAAHATRGRRPGWGSDSQGAGTQQEAGAQQRRTDTRSGALDREALDVLIVQQWTKTLEEPYDWAEWPLARYRLGEDVVRAAQGSASAIVHCTHPGAVRLAWVCAMVACGRAARLRSLDPGPLPDGRGEGEQLVRPDGARGWRCNVKRYAPDGPQLRYWVHPSGTIEFDAVCRHEELCPA
jgi:hypothetical protein